MRTRYTPQKYQCKKEHVSEFIVADADRLKTQKCKTCGKKAEHVRVANAINALPKSTIVYEKLEGGKMRRMYVDPQEPLSLAYAEKQGFQKREIQGIGAIRQFESSVRREMKEEYARMMRGEHRRKQEFDERYHSNLRQIINRSDVDSFTADVLRAALEDQSGFDYNREWEPDFHCAAFS